MVIASSARGHRIEIYARPDGMTIEQFRAIEYRSYPTVADAVRDWCEIITKLAEGK
jgi:hypothetical protein